MTPHFYLSLSLTTIIGEGFSSSLFAETFTLFHTLNGRPTILWLSASIDVFKLSNGYLSTLINSCDVNKPQ